MNNKYIHTEYLHNLTSPREIVPEIIKLLNPKSVIDIGCGIGTFIYCFKEQGISDVLGIDGSWCNKELINKFLAENEFLEKNLESKLVLDKKFDLVISLEVAEHLSEKSADIFVENLISSGNIILFSAAIPLQGGQNHINEQWLDYWEIKFLKHGYYLQDVIRPIFWDNPRVFWWYKQNMVLFTPKDYVVPSEKRNNILKNVIHPDLYEERVRYLNNVITKQQQELKVIKQGELSFLFNLKLFFKSIIGIKNFNKLKLKLNKKLK
jgi:SAM-dependent methyltransferase